MENTHESLAPVADLDQARIERLSQTESRHENIWQKYETIQHKDPVVVRHAGMVIRAVVTEPLDTTEHLEKPAIIIKHGFMASRPAYNDYAHNLAAAGHRVVHYGMPRTSSRGRQYHPRNIVNPLRTHSQAINGISAMLRERNPESPVKHWLIGHSMGGLATSEFISYRPQDIESAVLLGSAGLAKHSFKQMTLRAGEAVSKEIIPFVRDSRLELKLELGKHSLWHIGRNPLFLLREGYRAATGDALPNLQKASKAGVKLAAIWMAEDTFFPTHEIDQKVTDHFDVFKVTWGNHLKPQEFPKFAANDALDMFDALSGISTNRLHQKTVETIA